MALNDDLTAILRAQLGDGFERTPLPALRREFEKRNLRPLLQAYRRRGIDTASLERARQVVEDTLRTEQATRAAAVATSDAQAEADIAGLT